MSDVSRRSVLGAGVLVAAGAGIGVMSPIAAAAAAPALARRSMFVQVNGLSLRLAKGGTTYRATLVGIFDLQPKQPGADEDQFRLALESTDHRLVEGIYRVSHTKLAPVDLFLSPAGLPQSKVTLQAVVNRLV